MGSESKLGLPEAINHQVSAATERPEVEAT